MHIDTYNNTAPYNVSFIEETKNIVKKVENNFKKNSAIRHSCGYVFVTCYGFNIIVFKGLYCCHFGISFVEKKGVIYLK